MTTRWPSDSLLNLNDVAGSVGLNFIRALDDLARKVINRLGMRRVFAFEHDRLAVVARLADLRIELNAPEKRYPELLRHFLGAAAREDVHLMLAMRADKVAHIFDHSRDIDLHL